MVLKMPIQTSVANNAKSARIAIPAMRVLSAVIVGDLKVQRIARHAGMSTNVKIANFASIVIFLTIVQNAAS
jgi:hypothetical protein